MSNVLAIHSVGQSLMTFLQNAYPANLRTNVHTCDFKLISSGELAKNDNLETSVTLFLYRVTMNEHLRNTPRRDDLGGEQFPLSIDLHFLLTVWAGTPLVEQVILAWVMQQLSQRPLLDLSALSPEAEWSTSDYVQFIGHDAHLGRARAAVSPERVLRRARRADRCRTHARHTARARHAGRGGDGGPRMTAELLDRRVLAGIRFVDGVTGLAIARMLAVSAPNVRWIRNRSGDYVVAGAPGLEAHVTAFAAAPGAPPLGTLDMTLTVRDPLGEYLPRRATIELPRDPDPTHGDQPGSLFRPVTVPLYPAPIARTAPGWAVLRVTAQGLPGALLKVVEDGTDRVLARGQTDARGEALVAVPGIPVTTFNTGTGPVLATEVAATIQAFAAAEGAEPSDPDELETQNVSKSAPVQLASGRSLSLSL